MDNYATNGVVNWLEHIEYSAFHRKSQEIAPFGLGWPAAHQLAIRLANAEAFKQYKVEPFGPDPSKLRLVGSRWEWESMVGYGSGDLVVRVSFRRDGQGQRVELRWFVSKF